MPISKLIANPTVLLLGLHFSWFSAAGGSCLLWASTFLVTVKHFRFRRCRLLLEGY